MTPESRCILATRSKKATYGTSEANILTVSPQENNQKGDIQLNNKIK